jgi:hypothetical protein
VDSQLYRAAEGGRMKTILKLRPGLFEDLLANLLPDDNTREQAAFLFASASRADHVSFDIQESQKLTPDDFDSQEGHYLELKDETRARLIKHAHDLQASLIELHSHPGPWPAAFSPADLLGLCETVPHGAFTSGPTLPSWWPTPASTPSSGSTIPKSRRR